MKNIIIILVGLLVIGGAYYLITANNEPGQTTHTSQTYTFISGDESITIQYDEEGDTAELTYGGEKYQLEHVVSASGARYANEDESVVYWEHQGTATVWMNDEVVFEGSPSGEGELRDPSLDTRDELEGTSWLWKETLYNNDDVIAPNNPEAFVLSFMEEGRFSATTDCNGLGGKYTVTDSSISFGEIASTKMFCEGSQENEFTTMLSNSINYINTGEGELALMLEMDTGSVIFTPVVEGE